MSPPTRDLGPAPPLGHIQSPCVSAYGSKQETIRNSHYSDIADLSKGNRTGTSAGRPGQGLRPWTPTTTTHNNRQRVIQGKSTPDDDTTTRNPKT